MKCYIGTKIIRAVEMTDLEFEAERDAFNSAKNTVRVYNEGKPLLRSYGQDLCEQPQSRDPKDGYKVMYPDGYFSWSPKVVFENAYRGITQQEKNLV